MMSNFFTASEKRVIRKREIIRLFDRGSPFSTRVMFGLFIPLFVKKDVTVIQKDKLWDV